MMNNGIIQTLFSWTFLIGFIGGFLAQRAWCITKAKWLDMQEPGKKHRPGGLDRKWLAGAIALVITGSVTLTTQQTAEDTKRNFEVIAQLTRDVQDCQRQFNTVTKLNRKLTVDYNEIQARFQDAVLKRTNDLSELQKRFPVNSPGYIEGKAIIDGVYNSIVNQIIHDRDLNNAKREATKYPEPTCGK